MFRSARLKLTAWYLLIIVCISGIFSAVIYRNVSGQIERLIHMQNERTRNFFPPGGAPFPPGGAPPIISTEELEAQMRQLALTLVFINLGIVAFSGGAGYLLAGRTLKPIKLMLDEQNQFISDASHELRTPIATLRAEMETALMEKQVRESDLRRLIKSNLSDLDRLQALAENLLKLTRTHGGPDEGETVSLRDVLGAARKNIEAAARKKDNLIATDVAETIVRGNACQLTEVFTVLLDNAVKYSPPHTRVTVTATRTRNAVAVSISDRGQGISDSDLPHIFERFYRADKSRNLVEGYGLGLPIARKIVESHRGSIRASSSGAGSTFEVTLPLASVS